MDGGWSAGGLYGGEPRYTVLGDSVLREAVLGGSC